MLDTFRLGLDPRTIGLLAVERTRVRNKGDTSNRGLLYGFADARNVRELNFQRTVTNLAQAVWDVKLLMFTRQIGLIFCYFEAKSTPLPF